MSHTIPACNMCLTTMVRWARLCTSTTKGIAVPDNCFAEDAVAWPFCAQIEKHL